MALLGDLALNTKRLTESNHLIPDIKVDDYSASYDGSTSSVRSTDEDSAPDSGQESSLDDEDENAMGIGKGIQDDQVEQDPDEQQDYRCLGILMRRCGYRHYDKHNVRWFWPDELRERILTRDRIVKELQGYQDSDPAFCKGENIDEVVNIILKSYHKVFAILTLVDRGPHIAKVIKEKIEDKHLPLHISAEWYLYRATYRGSKTKLSECFALSDWGTNDRISFSTYQSALSPAILCFGPDGRTPRHEDFKTDVVMPFVHKEQGQQGGFGNVIKVRVHPTCHRFHNLLHSIQTNDTFALKVLIKADYEEFQSEVQALKQFNGFRHQHMVTLLMTWTLDGQYHMLFPHALCDLDEYWQNDPNPLLELDMVLWMSKQIVGIADALKHIHDPPFDPPSPGTLSLPPDYKFGTHRDLKPENILLFDSPTNSRGILVIADLGLARLNSAMSKTQTNSRTPGTPRYKPPECSILEGTVRRNYDIWTFGCLLLEWVCWAFEGDEARGNFMESLFAPFPSGSQADMFFDMVNLKDEEYDVIVKPQVVKKLKDLHKAAQCTQYFHDLLYLIEEEMIVVSNTSRTDSSTVHRKLNVMHSKMLLDQRYYVQQCAMPRAAKEQVPLKAKFKPLSPRDKQAK